jgi:Urate oxidase N-terminal
MVIVADALNIISRSGGAFASRWAHVVVGITWIGLLYYFNFVQVPAFAEMEAAARTNALDKLAWRALWWFRWAAAATVVTGILILMFQTDGFSNKMQLASKDYWKSAQGMSIATGILLGLTMFANVWLVIWPNQKKVIANARNVQAGGEADPAAGPAGRKALMASRMNTIFSFTLLMFMVGTQHFFNGAGFVRLPSSGNRVGYWIAVVVIWGLLELKALGVGGTAVGGLNAIYDTHKNALWFSAALVIVYYAIFYIFLKS